MKILLANDDGIFAPGIIAMARSLARLGTVYVVAPATEQSGVGHAITYLTPLTCKKIFDDQDKFRGWAVDGSPADSVKLGILELVPKPVDLVVSGINSGLNAGINVLYSGTVAAAIEGAFFGIPSVAVSLEHDIHADFGTAAELATGIIEHLISKKASDTPTNSELFNLNIPTAATRLVKSGGRPQVHVVPLGVRRYGDQYEKRQDPKGRDYYWSFSEPMEPSDDETDMNALAAGHVTITPLQFDLTKRDRIESLAKAFRN
ncbi:MAG: 5'/3'-nucleotidase SurE [Planctomycetota bacterium]|nr:5'/3'-nucleotidase SurE [Planctomycetota bacterium]